MVRGAFCFCTVALWSAVMFVPCIASLLWGRRGEVSLRLVREWWAPVLLKSAGVQVVTTEPPEAILKSHSGGTIFAANHESTLDIPVMFVALRTNFRFIAKHSLQYVPIIGWYMLAAGFIFVNRSSKARAIASLQRAAQRIRQGANVVIFPEGTRNVGPDLLPFKKGPFALALEAGVPIVPVAIIGSGAVMRKNSWFIRPGVVEVRIGLPIYPDSVGGDRDRLLESVESAIRNLRGRTPT